MTTLIILGNTNQHTFANSIIAANEKSKELFGDCLSNIQVVHSDNSFEKLRTEKDWLNHVKSNGISDEIFIERKIEINSDVKSIDRFLLHLESIMKGVSDSDSLIIDLTNGTSFQKYILSIAAYILDIQNQFVIDTAKLFETTSNKGFLNRDLLIQFYISAPLNTNLDNLAYLNLSEITRYKPKIEASTQSFLAIDNQLADESFFRENLLRSIQLKMMGDLSNDNAMYRIASASIVASFEELLNLILKLDAHKGTKTLTLGPKLNLISDRLKKISPPNFDFEFHQTLNKLFLNIRNKSTHKDLALSEIEKFKADLSVKLTFLLIDFYLKIIFPILLKSPKNEVKEKVKNLTRYDLDTRSQRGEVFYYSVDGDNTGQNLENLFLSCNEENELKNLSQSITQAMNKIEDLVIKRFGKNSIVFKAGDDLLFKGTLNKSDLENFQRIYAETTLGLTCSIGFGVSLKDVFLALKLAKAQKNKNSIIGLELIEQ